MAQDTRKDPRAKVLSLNVRYKSATVDEFIEHHSHDLSKGGMFIKTASPFASGTLLKFEIRIKEDQAIISGVGRVVWRREAPSAGAETPAGMGVKFIKLDGGSRELIDRVVDKRPNGPNFDEIPAELAVAGGRPQASPSLGATLDTAGSGGGGFFPSGPPAELPPVNERTVIKQTDEILAEALRGTGLESRDPVFSPPTGIDALPPPPPMRAAANIRKATLLGMPVALPSSARAAPEPGKSEPAPPPFDLFVAKDEAQAADSHGGALDVGVFNTAPAPTAPAASTPPPVAPSSPPVVEKKADTAKPAEAKPSPVVQPAPAVRTAVAAAPAPAPKKGGSIGMIVVALVLIGGGVGGFFYYQSIQKANPGAAPSTSTTASATAKPSATATAKVEPTTAPTLPASASASATTTASASASTKGAESGAPSSSASTAPTAAVTTAVPVPKPMVTASPPTVTTTTAAPPAVGKPPKKPDDTPDEFK